MGNKIEYYFRYMAFKQRLKHIPIFSFVIYNIKWRCYRPLYMRCWVAKRNFIVYLKNNGIIKFNENDKNLLALKNSHKGETAFIVGNGPSLRASDLDVLKSKKLFCFGANRINLIFNQTDWRPDCYMTLDKQILRDGDQSLFTALNTKGISMCLIAEYIYKMLPNHDNYGNIIHFYDKPNSYYNTIREFSINPLAYIVDGFTVTYSAIQMAYYMGFRKVYLIGVDFNYNKRYYKCGRVEKINCSDTYFDKRYDPQNKNYAYIDGMFQAYSTAQAFSANKDFKIYNASRKTELDIFEKVDLDVLLSSI